MPIRSTQLLSSRATTSSGIEHTSERVGKLLTKFRALTFNETLSVRLANLVNYRESHNIGIAWLVTLSYIFRLLSSKSRSTNIIACKNLLSLTEN
ncbi:unnamed protein product [Dovyalis caffra]|uniref:Uncharacterized protein n=1 Tax=Dovyalis caffra TaxID=77055 RepID=A0AAV1R8V6_9ROSI|nr:unnamed protein product [Dovyalis caffra]